MRWAHAKVIMHFRQQALDFVYLFPGERFEIFFTQHLDRAIGCALWISIIIVIFINALLCLATALGLTHFSFEVFAMLLIGIHVFSQELTLGWRQANLAIIAFGSSLRILCLLILTF